MSCSVMLEVTAKPECLEELITMFTENFKQTRVYEGCIEIYMTQSQDDPNTLLLVEQWETRAAYEKYLSWRAETGVVEKLAGMSARTPSIKYYDRLDA